MQKEVVPSYQSYSPCHNIFDRLKANIHLIRILSLFDSHHINLVIVPSNCTDQLQPLDIIVNKAVKEHLRKQFNNWYSSQVSKQINNGAKLQTTDLSMSVVKPLGATWMMNTSKYIKANPSIIINRYKGAGIC